MKSCPQIFKKCRVASTPRVGGKAKMQENALEAISAFNLRFTAGWNVRLADVSGL